MVITYNRADIVQDETGKFLHLELQLIMDDRKVIIKNIFPATLNYNIGELLHLPAHREVLLSNTTQE